MRATIGLAMAMGLAGCQRAPARPVVRMVAPAAVAAPAPTVAAPAAPPGLALVHSATCTDPEDIRQLGALYHADGGAPTIGCALPDGTIAYTMTLPRDGAEGTRSAIAAATFEAYAVRRLDGPGRAREVGNLMREVYHRPGFGTTPGMIFRDPSSTLGKAVIVSGAARRVHDVEGHTVLRIDTDLMGEHQFAVETMSAADDAVVDGAHVTAVGFHVDTLHERAVVGEGVVPVVYAVVVVAD